MTSLQALLMRQKDNCPRGVAFKLVALFTSVALGACTLPPTIETALGPGAHTPCSTEMEQRRSASTSAGADGDDLRVPVAIEQPMPGYPDSALRRGAQGLVVVKYEISLKGEVSEAKVVCAADYELGDAARAAVLAWRFKPATLRGAPVAVIRLAFFPFRFRSR